MDIRSTRKAHSHLQEGRNQKTIEAPLGIGKGGKGGDREKCARGSHRKTNPWKGGNVRQQSLVRVKAIEAILGN